MKSSTQCVASVVYLWWSIHAETALSFQLPSFKPPRRPTKQTCYSAEAARCPRRHGGSRPLTTNTVSTTVQDMQTQLWRLLSEAPPNQATPRDLTKEILSQIRKLEAACPTPATQVLDKLAGTWELVWTTQDFTAKEAQRGSQSWIGPLENQSYSNNSGRSNPVLPLEIQRRLDQTGILDASTRINKGGAGSRPVSTQSINLQKKLATNVVSFRVFRVWRVSLSIDIAILPHPHDARRVDVNFLTCRIKIPALKLDSYIPLGLIGLTKELLRQGWLRTTYINDDFRITRGHKGSVFILARPVKKPL